MSYSPLPIRLAFYSDFGTNYFLLNSYKFLFPHPSFTLLDITHHLQRYNYAYTNYVLKTTLPNLGENTWHLLFFDIFNTASNSDFFIYLPYKNSHILCPNNGLANYLFQSEIPNYIPIPIEKITPVPLENIFLALQDFITHFPQRKVALSATPPTEALLSDKSPILPFLYDNKLECKIITVDDFDNIILNCTREKFEEARANRNFEIYLMKTGKTSAGNCITTISNGYNDVKNGEVVAFFNTGGYLELAINQGGLAPLLGYSEYTLEAIRKNPERTKRLFYEPITIYFSDP